MALSRVRTSCVSACNNDPLIGVIGVQNWVWRKVGAGGISNHLMTCRWLCSPREQPPPHVEIPSSPFVGAGRSHCRAFRDRAGSPHRSCSAILGKRELPALPVSIPIGA